MKHDTKERLAAVGFFLPFGCVIVSFIMPCWQIFTFLKHGTWISLSTIWLINESPLSGLDVVSWLNNPTSWVGLHWIIAGLLWFIPASLTWMAVWFAIAYYTAHTLKFLSDFIEEFGKIYLPNNVPDKSGYRSKDVKR